MLCSGRPFWNVRSGGIRDQVFIFRKFLEGFSTTTGEGLVTIGGQPVENGWIRFARAAVLDRPQEVTWR